MGELRISIPSENLGFPYPVCKNNYFTEMGPQFKVSSKRLREFALMLLFVRVAMLSTIFRSYHDVSGSARELNAHFYSAASLKYHAQDT